MKPAVHILPHLTLEMLNNPILRQSLYRDLQKDYYWSEDFSPEFYAAQAQAGFIAITEKHRGEELLLPELQRSYAILDFPDLHVSRNVRRILKKTPLTLNVGLSLHTAAERIRTQHTHPWLTPRYEATLEAVNALPDSRLHIVSVLLRSRGVVTAGEIGYILGRTYTSLSGFASRDPRHRHHGTTQLVLLGHWLERHGFAFWNLGQPWMPYKFALGAREISRESFLVRWHYAIRESLRDSSQDGLNQSNFFGYNSLSP